jgi:ATP-dependent Clp protease ATP-binding subunit ClpB
MSAQYPFDQFSFSAKSQTAIKAALELAQTLQDQSVATGHLIYGLTVDSSVSLHHIFKDLNVDPDMFSLYVKGLPRESEGFRGTSFNRHVHTVFERAQQTAQELGSKLVEPEHMAIAMMSVKAGSCYETLKEFSIDPDYVRLLVLESMGLEAEDAPEWF